MALALLRALRRLAGRIAPDFTKRRLHVHRAKRALGSLTPLACDTSRLRAMQDLDLRSMLAATEIASAWDAAVRRTSRYAVPDGTGGVNPGDRRAIFHLIQGFRPRSVLEIGTHIGASTLHIAAALCTGTSNDGDGSLVSVDIVDVNDPVSRPWERYGTGLSPAAMVEGAGYGGVVQFIRSDSINYMNSCGREFDFIFLDGDHGAQTVYREIPAALRVLAGNGIILLHDYFPRLKPLWPDGAVIAGPWLAMERIRSEGAELAVIPLGVLPWPTKQGSNVTSLALVVRGK